jgi:rod shape-determining protein MreD
VRPILFFAIALLLAALEAALLRWVGGGAVPLALPLLVVVYLGLHAATVEGAVGAAAVGYVVDLAAAGPKGLMTFLAVALFLFSRLAANAVDLHGRIGYTFLSALGVFLYGVGALGLIRVVSPAEASPGLSLVGRVGVEALCTAAFAPLLHGFLRRVDGLFAREETGLLR